MSSTGSWLDMALVLSGDVLVLIDNSIDRYPRAASQQTSILQFNRFHRFFNLIGRNESKDLTTTSPFLKVPTSMAVLKNVTTAFIEDTLFSHLMMPCLLFTRRTFTVEPGLLPL